MDFQGLKGLGKKGLKKGLKKGCFGWLLNEKR